MNLHEYQAKQLFAEYGLPVSKGIAVDSGAEAVDAAEEIGGDRWVVKAQVHAGEEKAGGVSYFLILTRSDHLLMVSSEQIWLHFKPMKMASRYPKYSLNPAPLLIENFISVPSSTGQRDALFSWHRLKVGSEIEGS